VSPAPRTGHPLFAVTGSAPGALPTIDVAGTCGAACTPSALSAAVRIWMAPIAETPSTTNEPRAVTAAVMTASNSLVYRAPGTFGAANTAAAPQVRMTMLSYSPC
jgi:hypothetical protein